MKMQAFNNLSYMKQRQSGTTLLIVLLIIILVMGAGMTSSRFSKTELRIAHNAMSRFQAMAAAEAGILHAVDRLTEEGFGALTDELADGIGGGMTNLGSEIDLDGAGIEYRQGVLINASYFVRLDDNFDESPNDFGIDNDHNVIITSRGRAGNAERVIEVSVRFDQARNGLYGRDGITITGNTNVDSYDASAGPYGGANEGSEANVGSNGNVSLNINVEIKGDVSAGGTISTSGTITGTVTPGAPPQSFASQPPCGGPYSSSTGVSGGSYSGVATGNLTGTAGAAITLDAGTYCVNSITLTGGSTLVVNTGPVNIYATGDINLTGGGVVNNTNVPSNLNIYSSGSSINISGGAAASMTVYAPNASVVIGGGSDFYGSVIAADVTLNGGTNFHVDSSLNGSNTVTVAKWHEIRP